MALERVGARLLAGGQAVVDVPPVIRRDVAGIDAERFHRVDGRSTCSTFGQPSIRSRISPPGRTNGSVW